MDAQPASFDLFFQRSYPTNGGFMFDVVVTFQVALSAGGSWWLLPSGLRGLMLQLRGVANAPAGCASPPLPG